MPARGFTLIELVITLVVLSIIALGVTSYIGIGSRMYADVAVREQVLGQSRFVAERLVRELRNAAPNSVRISETPLVSCIEFTPLLVSGIYSRIPVAPESSTELELQLFGPGSLTSTTSLLVYPQQAADYYAASARKLALNSAQRDAIAAASTSGATVTLTLASNYSFPAHSPERRFYVSGDPVSYCYQAGAIYRYAGYVSAGVQPAPPVGGVLMAEGVSAAEFELQPAVLTRNAVVNLFLQFAGAEADMFFNYEVHLPNVP
ncbi:PilW family protein [Rheinheimera maricola]|uniref:Prepilin-type N-terminal cleavage/methylation domain-containing protein n=1 Tax=Rheinheimera maricola TaxID=2793282 RepID=A0ABS7XFC7_9GAMM|nr:prepilin-type N-terminal cleavage/methylation domain-containing protein [Rheinheimera maricola]MBZ9613829.1 prepilin-type N-terminal cleavage/methylation domain-containing protein [Rheinheimera maricola]